MNEPPVEWRFDDYTPTPRILPPRRASWRRARSALAIVAIVGLAALSAYLWSVNGTWVRQNETLRESASSLGAQLAQASADALAAQSELDDATARIRSLVNDEAQAGDKALVLTDVGAKLVECADARAQHIRYLNSASRYTAASLTANEAAVNEFCTSVIAAYVDAVAST